MSEPADGLVGRALAEVAYALCQELDPGALGLKPNAIREALGTRGVEIGGRDPQQTLNSTLNHHQDLFKGGPDYTWVWTPPRYDPTQGLSGAALAEEAYRALSQHDRSREGMHYGKILNLMLDEGVLIRGGNRGSTLFSALQDSDLFEWVSSGTFRVRR